MPPKKKAKKETKKDSAVKKDEEEATPEVAEAEDDKKEATADEKKEEDSDDKKKEDKKDEKAVKEDEKEEAEKKADDGDDKKAEDAGDEKKEKTDDDDVKMKDGDKDETKKDDDKKEDDKKDEDKMDVDKKDGEEEEDEEEESSEEEESTDDEDRGRGKRKRKSSLMSSFQPEDFTEKEAHPSSVKIIKGRGMKLGDIPTVRASIEKFKVSSEEMLSAHKFLFTMRGHPAKKDIKKNLLEFSGYLKELPKNYDEKQLEQEDEEIETVYSKKAYKLTTAQLKSMIDFFHIDRFTETPGGADKDTLVDYLLDFLGAPDPDLIVKADKKAAAGGKKGGKKASPKKKKPSPKKKKTPSKSKKSSAKDEETDTEDEGEAATAHPFALVREHQKGQKPSEEALRQWVRAYVVCFDMDTATTKHAIKSASERFGIDLSKKKALIKHLLAEEM